MIQPFKAPKFPKRPLFEVPVARGARGTSPHLWSARSCSESLCARARSHPRPSNTALLPSKMTILADRRLYLVLIPIKPLIKSYKYIENS